MKHSSNNGRNNGNYDVGDNNSENSNNKNNSQLIKQQHQIAGRKYNSRKG